ncbi:uncharacterized protein LOC128993251 [Macrosteles quadrilineatus]|uniref:uncharacterized protein LOC128993251 n=1 Tax=Macrosteles quadrilineatus TaxID=74068 RepID=UPI0023E29489|nr:uncharacterized protein LOC128993251 [Macrosteles quadrilineatus]
MYQYFLLTHPHTSNTAIHTNYSPDQKSKMCGTCGGNNQSNSVTAAYTNKAVTFSEVEAGKLNECCKPKSTRHPDTNGLASSHQSHGDRVPCVGSYEQHLFETPDGDICENGPKEPYHVPGYTGHVPTVQSRNGHTFGQDTHDVLASKLGQSSLSRRGYHICPEPMHQPYRIPGYTGYVPGLKYQVGGTYGSDTHKLMYSVNSYPNRQENLSPYKLSYGSRGSETSANDSAAVPTNGYTHDEPNAHNLNNTFNELPHGDTLTSSTYQKPKEKYLKPQLKYRIGDTYATRANLTLVDSCINKESEVIVSTREFDDTQVIRTQDCLEERVEGFPYVNKPIRHRPMVPGFDTFIDALRGARGQRFEFTALSPSHLRLQQQLVRERGIVRETQEATFGLGGNETTQKTPSPARNCDELPYGYSKYGGHQKYTNSVIHDFSSNYRRRMSPEWAPAGISRPDPPIYDVPGEIYNKHMGLLPGYTAHVPGSMFRCGKTFTDDSRDARKALRGDRF